MTLATLDSGLFLAENKTTHDITTMKIGKKRKKGKKKDYYSLNSLAIYSLLALENDYRLPSLVKFKTNFSFGPINQRSSSSPPLPLATGPQRARELKERKANLLFFSSKFHPKGSFPTFPIICQDKSSKLARRTIGNPFHRSNKTTDCSEYFL